MYSETTSDEETSTSASATDPTSQWTSLWDTSPRETSGATSIHTQSIPSTTTSASKTDLIHKNLSWKSSILTDVFKVQTSTDATYPSTKPNTVLPQSSYHPTTSANPTSSATLENSTAAYNTTWNETQWGMNLTAYPSTNGDFSNSIKSLVVLMS